MITNSRPGFSQEFNIYMYHTFYSHSIEIINFYDESAFTPEIALHVQFLDFYLKNCYNND